MYKKRFITLLIIFLMLLCKQAFAQSDAPYFEILSPTERQSYQPGDTVEIQFKAHGFSPSNQQGITVRLAERSTWQRVRIGYITQPQNDGVYTFNWTIPDNFFERHDFDQDSYFKIILRASVNGKLVRKISTKSLLYIQEPAAAGPTSVLKTTATVEEAPEPEKVIPTNAEFASRYSFEGFLEPWLIRKLTIVNDAENDGFEPDPSEISNVIETVYLRYPNEAGQTVEKSIAFTSYRAVFAGLDFYVPKNKPAYMEVWVKLNPPGQFSGENFRLGLQETGNTASTFEAISQITSTTDNVMNFAPSAYDVKEFVVRSGLPEFAVIGDTSRQLYSGDIEAYEFTFSAASNIGLSRLVFEVTQSGLTVIDQARILRNGNMLESGDAGFANNVYLMWDAGAVSCFAHTQQNGAGTGMDCNGGMTGTSKLIVAFNNEEQVNSTGTNTYKLRFNISGVSSGDQLIVRLEDGDDVDALNIGGTVNNTGTLFNNGAGNEIFGTATDWASEATTLTNRNIIWTDRSAELHRYSTITPGNPPSVSAGSSADFTNGYLLKINTLPPVVWSR